jgi:CelD/BcsL family acetyltransferase involved in cellulose biosynthesis
LRSSIHVQLGEGLVAVDHGTSVSAGRLIGALQAAGHEAARQSPA